MTFLLFRADMAIRGNDGSIDSPDCLSDNVEDGDIGISLSVSRACPPASFYLEGIGQLDLYQAVVL